MYKTDKKDVIILKIRYSKILKTCQKLSLNKKQ